MFHHGSVCHRSPSTHVIEERNATEEPKQQEVRRMGEGEMAISRGPTLYDTVNNCKGRILIRILLQEDGGRERSLRRKDRDLAFVS